MWLSLMLACAPVRDPAVPQHSELLRLEEDSLWTGDGVQYDWPESQEYALNYDFSRRRIARNRALGGLRDEVQLDIGAGVMATDVMAVAESACRDGGLCRLWLRVDGQRAVGPLHVPARPGRYDQRWMVWLRPDDVVIGRIRWGIPARECLFISHEELARTLPALPRDPAQVVLSIADGVTGQQLVDAAALAARRDTPSVLLWSGMAEWPAWCRPD